MPRHEAAGELGARLKVSPLIAQILLNRGVSDPEECYRFLQPNLKSLHDPGLMPGMPVAAGRIARAIRDGEPTVVYGDYDVDGITGTAILWHAIRILGGEVTCYTPHRLDEGYGLNPEAIAQICGQGAKVIVTVDCGITAVEPAKVAKAAGVDLVVTDHHDLPRQADGTAGELPDCFAIVHPRLPRAGEGEGEAYPNPHLCGSGVAFKLAWALGQAMAGGGRVSGEFREFLIDAMSLAALGTIADVVPLLGENRILTHFGLRGICQSKMLGIKALLESTDSTKKVDAYKVGFVLAPRLNACGRMGHANLAVEMLTSADADKALEIAKYLNTRNRERQTLERRIVAEAVAQVTELGLDGEEHRAIVVGAKGWHAGVNGIVASRLVDRFYRPAVVVSLDEENGQGSGRSVAGFHLASALSAMGEFLEGSGGHEMAAGLRLRAEQFEPFREAFLAHAAEHIAPELLVPTLRLDVAAELGQITRGLVDEFEKLGPFGQGNPKPLFGCLDVELAGAPNRCGQSGDHLQLKVRQGAVMLKCIAFGMGDMAEKLRGGMRIDVAAEPSLNHYNGSTTVQLEVKDLRVR